MKPTQRLHEAGQSLWLDNITRGLLDRGTAGRPGPAMSSVGPVFVSRRDKAVADRVPDELPDRPGTAVVAQGRQRVDAMFSRERINVSEDQAVLHVALRAPKAESIRVDGTDVVGSTRANRSRM